MIVLRAAAWALGIVIGALILLARDSGPPTQGNEAIA